MTERSQTTGSVTLDVGYEYDTDGRLGALTTPSGQAITYEYEDGRVSGLRVNASYILNQVLYQPFGPTRAGHGATPRATTDVRHGGQLVSISSAGSSTYTYFADGRSHQERRFLGGAPSSSRDDDVLHLADEQSRCKA